jgi:hypothetical protein
VRLHPKDKISLYLQTHRLRLEMEGKVSSVKEQGIEQLLAKLSQNEQITSTMVVAHLARDRQGARRRSRAMARNESPCRLSAAMARSPEVIW